MSEFKFTCPNCQQKILGSEDWIGRKMECPTCKTKFIIPDPAAAPVPAPAKKATRPVPAVSGEQIRGSSPAPLQPKPAVAAKKATRGIQVPQPQPAPAQATQAKPPAPSPESTAAPAESTTPTRVAVLNAASKMEIMRAARSFLSDKNHWTPGVGKAGELVYALKVQNGKIETAEPGDPEANRFSLMGAILREFTLRDVARNAQGRRRLLDHEIPAAIKQVLHGTDDADSAPDTPLKALMAIDHAQTLETLDLLEERYRARRIEAASESASKKFGVVRLQDLLRKMDQKLHVYPEDIVIALFHELQAVNDRLERLERKK